MMTSEQLELDYWRREAYYASGRLFQVRRTVVKLAWACLLLAIWAVWATVWSVLSQ
jgi:hypothetical protein